MAREDGACLRLVVRNDLAVSKAAVPPHVYNDYQVTSSRLAAFANSDRDEQLIALLWLRRRATVNLWEIAGVAFAIALAAMAIMYSFLSQPLLDGVTVSIFGEPPPNPTKVPPWLVVLLYAFMVIIVPLGVVLSATLLLLWNAFYQSRAATWLRFYEEELALRYAATGKKADRWRKAHPIDWD